VLVQPDVFVVPAKETAGGCKGVRTLLMAVEVQSPSTARHDRVVKRRIYQEFDVRTYWIVDADARVVEVWHPVDERRSSRTPCGGGWRRRRSRALVERAAREQPEVQEIAPESGCRVVGGGLVEEESQELLACAQDLATPMAAPALVAGREGEQLEGPLQRALEPIGPPRFPRPDGALDLASNVRELLGQAERAPASPCEFGVDRH
jgi:hypothetical protein